MPTELSSYFRIRPLAQILEDGKIHIVLSRPAQRSATGVAEGSREILAWRRRRNRVGSGVVPALNSLSIRRTSRAGGVAEIVWVANHVWPRCARPRVRRIERQEWREGLS